MSEQGSLLEIMIEREIEKNKGTNVSISNHFYETVEKINVGADEIAFITMIKVQANSDFVFTYYSVTESRKFERIVPAPEIIEYNIISKHLSNIKFDMSNADKYEVSIVKLKFIK